MSDIANLKVKIGGDTSGLEKSLNSAKNAVSGFAKTIITVLAAVGITDVFSKAIKSAMDVEASLQQVNRTMGASAAAFTDWANNGAMAFNMGKTDAIKFGAVYSNLISTFAKDTATTTRYTEDLLKASAVVASSTGRSMSDVMERIRSGMLGNTEAIEDLGINVGISMISSTEAFKKFANGKSWAQLDFKTQQQIRLFAILEQSTKKYGDAVADNTNSRLQQFVAQLQNVQLSLGQAFLPIFNAILPALTAMAAGLARVMAIFAQFSQAIFGKANAGKATEQQAAAVSGLGDAYEEAGKKASNSVAGFDEVNTLSGGGSGGAGAGAGSTGAASLDIPAPEIDTEAIPAKIQAMVDNVKAKLSTIWDGMTEGATNLATKLREAYAGISDAFKPLIDAKEPIKTALIEIGQTFVKHVNDYLMPAYEYIALNFVPKIVKSFTESFVPIFASTAIWAIQLFSTTFKNVTTEMKILWESTWLPSLEKIKNAYTEYFPLMAKAMQTLLDGTIKPFVDYILNGFVIPVGSAITSTLVPIFTDVLVFAVGEFAKSFQFSADMINKVYKTVIQPVFELLKTVVLDGLKVITSLWKEYGASILENVSGIFQGIRNIFNQLWTEVFEPIITPFLEQLSTLWDEHLKGLVEGAGDFIAKLIEGALEILNKFILPLISYLIEKLSPTFVSVFNTIIEKALIVVGKIADAAKAILKALGGVVTFITGVFTGDWEKAWQGIETIFSGIWDLMLVNYKEVINGMIGLINVFIKYWNSIELKVPEVDMGPLIGKFGGYTIGTPKIGEIPKLAKGGITNGPTQAIVGDNVGGREVISPLDDLMGMVVSAVSTTMQMMGGNQQQQSQGDIVINVDGTTLARIVGPYLNQEQQRIGSSAIIRPI